MPQMQYHSTIASTPSHMSKFRNSNLSHNHHSLPLPHSTLYPHTPAPSPTNFNQNHQSHLHHMNMNMNPMIPVLAPPQQPQPTQNNFDDVTFSNSLYGITNQSNNNIKYNIEATAPQRIESKQGQGPILDENECKCGFYFDKDEQHCLLCKAPNPHFIQTATTTIHPQSYHNNQTNMNNLNNNSSYHNERKEMDFVDSFSPSPSSSSSSPSPSRSRSRSHSPSSADSNEYNNDNNKLYCGRVISILPDKLFLSCTELNNISTLVDKSLIPDQSIFNKIKMGDEIDFTINDNDKPRIAKNKRGQTVYVAQKVYLNSNKSNGSNGRGSQVFEGTIYNFKPGHFGFISSPQLTHFTYFPAFQLNNLNINSNGDSFNPNGKMVTFAIEDRDVINNRGELTHRAKWVKFINQHNINDSHDTHNVSKYTNNNNNIQSNGNSQNNYNPSSNNNSPNTFHPRNNQNNNDFVYSNHVNPNNLQAPQAAPAPAPGPASVPVPSGLSPSSLIKPYGSFVQNNYNKMIPQNNIIDPAFIGKQNNDIFTISNYNDYRDYPTPQKHFNNPEPHHNQLQFETQPHFDNYYSNPVSFYSY